LDQGLENRGFGPAQRDGRDPGFRPASPERGRRQPARGTKHQTTLNRVLVVSVGPARLNGHCCGLLSFIDTGGGRFESTIWIQSPSWLGPPASGHLLDTR